MQHSFNRTNMELKFMNLTPMPVDTASFNRTNMELKSRREKSRWRLNHAFNRTNMELKLKMALSALLEFGLLIVPIWN